MQLRQSLAQAFESLRRGLDQEQPLGCRLHLALPAIDRFNFGSDVDAGCQLPLHQRLCDAAGLFERTASGKNEPFVGHIRLKAKSFTRSIRGRPMATQIKFGTSGWRAVMAEEFTFANVGRAVHGIARYVVSQKADRAKVIVGRDPRFLGESFCATAAEILSSYGITPLVIAEPAPTPTISYAVIQSKADGAINFTASHNPPEYNGIKFSTPDGAPALPEVTKAIESEIAAISTDANRQTPRATKAEAQSIDPRRMYLSRLREIVDLDVIKKAGIKIAFDPMWGSARGYSDGLLREAGVTVGTVHDVRDVLFGGHAPEPDDHLLEDLRQKMREIGASIGIA